MKPYWLALAILALAVAACGDIPSATVPATSTAQTATRLPDPTTAPTADAPSPTSPPPATTAPQQTAGAASTEQIDQLPVVYSLPQMDQASVQKDLIYKEVEGQKLQLDVYAPAQLTSASRLPAVLFVHGDPLYEGQNVKNARPFVTWGQLLAASGMIGIAFNWRVPNGAADIEDAIQYVRQHADELQIDPDRLGIFAFSSGATALNLELAAEGGPDYLRCLVVYYGNLTLPLNRIFGLKKTAEARYAPILLATAAKDQNVSTDMPALFAQQATSKGIQVELLEHPTGVHGFDVLNDDDQSRTIIKQTIAFLQAHLLAES